ncbi:MAG: sulfotransferase family 2 domain-containing protein [Cyanobacteria bacterium J06635_15]
MISEEGKFIFFHNPKAAGNSVIQLIRKKSYYKCQLNSENKAFSEFTRSRAVLWPNHAHPSLMKDYLTAPIFDAYFKFSFVRNPKARLVSIYHYTCQKEREIYSSSGKPMPKFNQLILQSENFESWLLNTPVSMLPKPQIDFFTDNGEIVVDFIGKTEKLAVELAKISRILGIDSVLVNYLNKSEHATPESYFTKEMNNKVEKLYGDDFRIFGYLCS